MLGNHPPHRSGSRSAAPDRPLRDDREQNMRARQAAEALFAPKPPPVIVDKPPADTPTRQSRMLKSAPQPPVPPPVEAADTPEPATPVSIPPPHVARIRAWVKYGMTLAQVAEVYKVPVSEITRIFG